MSTRSRSGSGKPRASEKRSSSRRSTRVEPPSENDISLQEPTVPRNISTELMQEAPPRKRPGRKAGKKYMLYQLCNHEGVDIFKEKFNPDQMVNERGGKRLRHNPAPIQVLDPSQHGRSKGARRLKTRKIARSSATDDSGPSNSSSTSKKRSRGATKDVEDDDENGQAKRPRGRPRKTVAPVQVVLEEPTKAVFCTFHDGTMAFIPLVEFDMPIIQDLPMRSQGLSPEDMIFPTFTRPDASAALLEKTARVLFKAFRAADDSCEGHYNVVASIRLEEPVADLINKYATLVREEDALKD